MESLHPREIELGLDRVRAVRDRLGLSSPPFTIVTVGGTNGKGSTVAMLTRIWHDAGYRVGAYTSPHLLTFHERIRIGDRMATDKELCEAFGRVEQARGDIPLTYFEFGTLAALDLFREQRMEIAVLEVGLGGRLDAVNVWEADVAIVTSVGTDHQDWLGTDREQIGYEKAGIFRPGQCAVCGDPHPPQSLLRHARDIGARLRCLNRDFEIDTADHAWSWRRGGKVLSGLPYPAMRGEYQLHNAACVLMALDCLADRWPVTAANIRVGLTQAVLPGRFQTLPGYPRQVLDVAHNVEAAEALAHTLAAQTLTGTTYAVCAMLRDKPMADVARQLAPHIAHWHIAGIDLPRGASVEVLHAALEQAGVAAVTEHPDIESAYRAALSQAGPDDRVLVFGSFHTVGVILRVLPTP
jgi:dihydrofolate synthase/folylpolyglutamate synthase